MHCHVPPYMKKIHVQVKVTADEMDNMDQEFHTKLAQKPYTTRRIVLYVLHRDIFSSSRGSSQNLKIFKLCLGILRNKPANENGS